MSFRHIGKKIRIKKEEAPLQPHRQGTAVILTGM
jgi:hypothetical protein